MKLKKNLVLYLLLLAISKVFAAADEDIRTFEPIHVEKGPTYSERKDSYYQCCEGGMPLTPELPQDQLEVEGQRYKKQKIIWNLKDQADCLNESEKIIDPQGRGDRRTPLRKSVQNKEYQFNCYLEIYYANVDGQARIYYGSGILIAPNLILTAGHNLYDIMDGGCPDRIDCFAACFKNEVLAEATVFPKINPQSIYVHPDYVSIEDQKTLNGKSKSEQKDECYQFSKSDIALIVFDKETSPFREVEYVSAYRIPTDHLVKSISKKSFTITGYPGMQIAHTMTGKLLPPTTHERLCYDIDTQKGQSGSGICFTNKDNSQYCIGVHTCAGNSKEPYNIGALIDEQMGAIINKFRK